MAPLRGREGSARVAVLTIVQEELEAAQKVLGLRTEVPGASYYVGANSSPRNDFDVVLCKAADRGNIPSGEAVRDIVEDFYPGFLILVGIAGGICKDDGAGRDGIRLGDVVVADYIEYSEYRKYESGRDLARGLPLDHPSLYLRARFAERRLRSSNWEGLIPVKRPEDGSPKATIGNIVAGEKLLGDRDNTYQQKVLQEFDKALAIDMESVGFARAIFKARSWTHYNPQYLVIRGISDFCNSPAADNDDTRKRWRQYAACAAAAFAKSVIDAVLAETAVLRPSASVPERLLAFLKRKV